jgi:hypothetical protein
MEIFFPQQSAAHIIIDTLTASTATKQELSDFKSKGQN